MSEVPPPMPGIPKIPRGRLWMYLLVPPVFMAAVSLLCFAVGDSRAPSSIMEWLPGALGFLSLGAFIGCLIGFILLLNRRYATSTVVLLTFGYVIGQGVIVVAMFFGACVLMMSHP